MKLLFKVYLLAACVKTISWEIPYSLMITVIGIFDRTELAEQASSYLLANEFEREDVDIHTSGSDADKEARVNAFFSHLFDSEQKGAHYASLSKNGSVVTVHALSVREAQEALDALNNHGAIEVNADEQGNEVRSEMVERVIEESKRLK